jgi:hypothetical protein
MGNRLSRSSVLSDPNVIDRVNRDFVAAELNVTDQGFPADLVGLAFWKRVYRSDPAAQTGFGNQVVVDATGQYPLASGDDGQLDRWAHSINYNPQLYSEMLGQALERWHRLQAIQAAETPPAEKQRQIDDLEAEVGRAVAQAYRRKAW